MRILFIHPNGPLGRCRDRRQPAPGLGRRPHRRPEGRRLHERRDPAVIAAADEAWVTMHEPKIERRHKQGEETAAAALAAIGAVARAGGAASACGGGGQLGDEQADAALRVDRER